MKHQGPQGSCRHSRDGLAKRVCFDTAKRLPLLGHYHDVFLLLVTDIYRLSEAVTGLLVVMSKALRWLIFLVRSTWLYISIYIYIYRYIYLSFR